MVSEHGLLSWAGDGAYRLRVKSYASKNPSDSPILLVVLHGDSPGKNPNYHYTFASRASMEPDVVAVGILRPGYADPEGNVSAGQRGKSNGDSFNLQNTDAIAAAISELKGRYRSRKVVVAGHSGGAVIAANILARHPRLIDEALLVACACDVPAWRESFYKLTGFASMRQPIETLSPIDLVEGVHSGTPVVLLTGADDKVTPPSLCEGYVQKAVRLGKNVTLTVIPEKGHNIFDSREVFERLLPMLK